MSVEKNKLILGVFLALVVIFSYILYLPIEKLAGESWGIREGYNTRIREEQIDTQFYFYPLLVPTSAFDQEMTQPYFKLPGRKSWWDDY